MSLKERAKEKFDRMTDESQPEFYNPRAHGIVSHFAEVIWRENGCEGPKEDYWEAAKNLLVTHTIEAIASETTVGYAKPEEVLAKHIYRTIFVLPRDIAAKLIS